MKTQKGYELAKEWYAQYGVDTEAAIEACESIPISLHCWQGDDITGYEKTNCALTGGIQVIGDYPGKAKTADQLRNDMSFAFGFVPGKKKVNIHAIYAETDRFVDRDAIRPEHFKGWADWAVENGFGLDLNPTFFHIPKPIMGRFRQQMKIFAAFGLNMIYGVVKLVAILHHEPDKIVS